MENVGAFLTTAEVDVVFSEITLPSGGRYAIGLDLGLTKDRSVACLMRTDGARVLVERFLTYIPR